MQSTISKMEKQLSGKNVQTIRVEGLLVSVRIHQRKDSRGDRVGGGRVGGGRVGGDRVGGGMDRGRRDCPAGYCFGLWGGWNI
jgi:hypothetical protein